jgi:predicted RND superfamily exporter protein
LAWLVGESVFDRFAADISTHPRRWLLLVVMATVAAAAGLSRLQFDDDPRAIYMGDDEPSARLQRLHEEFGADDQDVILMLRAADVFEPRVMNAARDLWLAAARVPGVERVYGIHALRRRGSRLIPLIPRSDADPQRFAEAKRRAVAHPLAVGQFLSADATTLVIVARLAGDPESLAKLRQPVADLRRLARETAEGTGIEVLATGHPVLRIDILSSLAEDLATFVIASAIVSVMIAWGVFGRLAAVLIVVLTPVFGVLWVVSLMPAVGLKLNGVNAVLPTLVYAIGVTDAVHLVIDARRRLAAGDSRRQAVQSMLESLALPCFLTSLTTAIGFGSLSLAHEPLIRQFGLICAAGTMLNFAAVMTVLPLLMLTRLADHLLPAGGRRLPDGNWLDLMPLVRLVEAAPGRIVAAALLGSAVMIAMCSRLGPDFVVTETIPDDNACVVALERLDTTMGGGMIGYVVVDWPRGLPIDAPEVADALEQVHRAIESEAEFCNAFSVRNLAAAASTDDEPLWQATDILGDVPPEDLRRLVHPEACRLVVSFRIKNIGAAQLTPAFDDLEARLAEVASSMPGFDFHLTGTLPVVSRNLWAMIGDLARSLTASTVLVFAVIGLTLRSWRLGIVSLLPNVLPLLATSALLVSVGEPLRIVSVVSYSLCLGLAVDDTIHFLVRFQREHRHRPVRESIEHAIQTAGMGIVTSTAILSHMPSIRWLALLCDVAMLTALIGVLVILPAMLLCFWPEPMKKRDENATTACRPHPSP